MLREWLGFNEWANRRVLGALHDARGGSKPLELFAHIVIAEKIWLMRLAGENSMGIDKSPAMSLKDCELLSEENREAFSQMYDRFQANLNLQITYRNLNGQKFSTSVLDILTHVVFHGVYHRGQIALAMRTGGSVPVNTDYITFVREKS